MKKEVNEMWKEQEGNKVIWKVQCPKGVLSFKRKKDAISWVEYINKLGTTIIKISK